MRVFKTNSESRPRHVSTIARHGGMTKTCSFMNHSNFLFIPVLLKSSIFNLVKHAVFWKCLKFACYLSCIDF